MDRKSFNTRVLPELMATFTQVKGDPWIINVSVSDPLNFKSRLTPTFSIDCTNQAQETWFLFGMNCPIYLAKAWVPCPKTKTSPETVTRDKLAFSWLDCGVIDGEPNGQFLRSLYLGNILFSSPESEPNFVRIGSFPLSDPYIRISDIPELLLGLRLTKTKEKANISWNKIGQNKQAKVSSFLLLSHKKNRLTTGTGTN